MKVLNILAREERLFISIVIQEVPMLRQPVQKNGSATSISSEDVFPSDSLSAKNMKLVIKGRDSKDNENNVAPTGWIQTKVMFLIL